MEWGALLKTLKTVKSCASIYAAISSAATALFPPGGISFTRRWKCLNRRRWKRRVCARSGSMQRKSSTGWHRWRRSILPYIGNDLMDLKHPGNAKKSMDSRFLKKILTEHEIEIVNLAENSDTALWSIWSCKDDAYIVIKKSHNEDSFMPRRWSVNILSLIHISEPTRLG